MHGEYDTTCSYIFYRRRTIPSSDGQVYGPTHLLFERRPRDRRVLVLLPRLCFLGTFLPSPIHPSFVDDFLSSAHFSYPVSNFVTTYLYDMPMQTDRQSRVVFLLNPVDFYPSIRIASGAQRIYRPPISAFDLIFDFLYTFSIYALNPCSCSVIEALLLYSLSVCLCITIRAMTIYSP
jgi:hypothetical protein